MQSKEIFVALATYKKKVDETLIGILEKLDEDKLLAGSGAYFPNALAQAKHVFGSDVNWVKRMIAAFPGNAVLSRSRFADYDLEALKARPASERGRFFDELRGIDDEVLAFVSALDEGMLASSVTYKGYTGNEESHELWKILLHWFNHGVHHRGTISGQLDALGVDNDYSSLMPKI